MLINNVELRILIKGKPITEYANNGNLFVEGREGSNFEIEFINRNPYRVEAIITVDGLSVIDGKEGSMESSGYLVEANDTLIVPGWKVNDGAAARFVFSGKNGSYATATTGSSRNSGVIGCMVYAERHRRPITKTAPQRPVPKANPFPGHGWAGGWADMSRSSGLLYNGDPTGQTPVTEDFFFSSDSYGGSRVQTLGAQWDQAKNAILGSDMAIQNADRAVATASMATAHAGLAATTASMAVGSAADATSRGYAPTRATFSSSGTKSARPLKRTSAALLENTQVNNLGTGFGAATIFETETAQFDRGDLLGILILYYDNARGLRARGIEVGRPRVRHTASTPEAFPGMKKSCTPPPGWKG
jgi:hypothetical protein